MIYISPKDCLACPGKKLFKIRREFGQTLIKIYPWLAFCKIHQ